MKWWKLPKLGEQLVEECQDQWTKHYDQMMQQQQLLTSTSTCASSRAIDEVAESALAQAHASAREAQIKLQDLQRAIASIVLRLKVLDVEALEKDLGEDGTVPLRLALSELKELVRAYDGMPKNNMPDYGLSTTASSGVTSSNPYYYNKF